MSVSLDKEMFSHIARQAERFRVKRSIYVRQLILKDMNREHLSSAGH